jgi:hypothetical protein
VPTAAGCDRTMTKSLTCLAPQPLKSRSQKEYGWWAQQGSNLRPLACKTRKYRRWTWLDVARRGLDQQKLWLGVARRGLVPVGVGSPFGSPTSLASLMTDR